jgi:hypothetical protein
MRRRGFGCASSAPSPDFSNGVGASGPRI